MPARYDLEAANWWGVAVIYETASIIVFGALVGLLADRGATVAETVDLSDQAPQLGPRRPSQAARCAIRPNKSATHRASGS
jgi:hypothetical protein